MEYFQLALYAAAFLCSLVAGFLFAFAVVVMPGIARLGDRDYIRAFQVIDGVIQNSQPLFIVVWVGSAIAIIAAAALGLGHLAAVDSALLVLSVVVYLLGVQLPTFAINVPLNNRLQSLDVEVMEVPALQVERVAFEARWNRWNARRTVLACIVSALLIAQV